MIFGTLVVTTRPHQQTYSQLAPVTSTPRLSTRDAINTHRWTEVAQRRPSQVA